MAQNKTIFLDYKVSGVFANAFSVELASSDGTYGLKELESGNVIAASSTAVENPTPGRYEYTFDAVNSIVYMASWKIVSGEGDQAIYKERTVAPIYAGNFNAVTETRGIFTQQSVGMLQVRITDFNGMAVDPELILLTITKEDTNEAVVDQGGETISDLSPEKVDTGFYVFDWVIDRDQDVGKYIATWTYTVDGVTAAEAQRLVVADNSAATVFYSGPRVAVRQAFEHLIYCAQSIPVYHEQARPSRDNKTFQFTKGQWNQTPSVTLYRNQEIVTQAAEIDYKRGSVKFIDDLLDQDVIAADYTFRWFSDEQLDQFLDNGINMLNSFPPFRPAFNFTTLLTGGTQFLPAVLYGAAVDAMRSLMMCLQFQQPAQFFGGLERAREIFGNLETLKQNYTKTWETLLGQKKFGPYPQTRLVVTPEFTLPGGRSRWFRMLFSGSS